MYYGLIIVNFFSIIWMFILFLQNKRSENKFDDSLNIRYQVKENLAITRIMMICGSIQAVLILLHSVLNIIRRDNVTDKVLYRILALDIYVSHCLFQFQLRHFSSSHTQTLPTF